MHVILSILILLIAAPAAAEDISGIPDILDGDTVDIAGTRIRLLGIDAPERDQACLDAAGASWPCGRAATRALIRHAGGRAWTCRLDPAPDVYGRRLGTCFLGAEDLDRWMVANGWALAFRRYQKTYVDDEAAAQRASAGLWAGSFVAPWDWRHHDCAAVLGRPMADDAAAALCARRGR